MNRFQQVRQEYTGRGLDERDVARDPFMQFRHWLDEAFQADLHEPNAMTLATCTASGRPSARVVLLKSFDGRGLVFFTNYESRKAAELAENPHAALVFWWGKLARQIRVEGAIDKIAAEESDAYYYSRPLGSRLGAWVSPQSRPIPHRDVLQTRWRELETQYGQTPPRPAHWGGYRLAPHTFEFWQGQPNRLHDRLQYTRQSDGTWHLVRLAP